MNMYRPDPDTVKEALPGVSVIIISKGNRKLLEQAVASIGRADYPRVKLQTVVLEETDHPQPLESWVDYYSIPVKNRGFGFARNRALSYARNPIILFTDDDCTVEKNWIMELVDPFQKSDRTIAVGGAVFVPPCGAVGQCENIIGFPGGGMKYYHFAGGKTVRRETFSTCNCAVRRAVIDAAGGFDESMKLGGEDERISRTIAGRGEVLYHPGAVVYHQPRNSLPAVFKWFVRRGYAEVHQALMVRQSSYRFSEFARKAIILRMAALVLLSFFFGRGVLLLLPAAVLYYVIILWKFRWARRYYPSITTLLMIPPVRTVMDVGRDWGIIKGLLTVNRSAHITGGKNT